MGSTYFLGVTMIKRLLSTLAIGCAFWACDSSTPSDYINDDVTVASSNSNTTNAIPVDYSLGRAMNARLGRGINLGNSWDSDGYDDTGWNNPIRDKDFATIKAAGFNSVRIPVRWQNYSDYKTHTVDPERLKGVKDDISLAIANGLAVVVNFHHYTELNCYGGGGSRWNYETQKQEKCTYNAEKYQEEKAHFIGMWSQVAAELNSFADSMLVFEILNEPVIPKAELVDQLMNDAYNAIRAVAKNKTIMFESYAYAKFEYLNILHLPQDGNIIFTGHYYEPYAFTHQGQHGNQCRGDAANGNKALTDFRSYKALAFKLYPDINKVDNIPLNLGEFGVAGGSDMGTCTYYDSKGNPIEGEWPSDQKKAEWAQKTVAAALNNGMSFHYWGFGQTGGFDAYNVHTEQWYPGFPQALLQ